MIGKNIKGVNQLWRLTKDLATPILVKFNGKNEYSICVAVKTEKYSQSHNQLLIFNEHYSSDQSNVNSDVYTKIVNEYHQVSKYPRIIVIPQKSQNYNEWNRYFEEMVLLPNNYFNEYEKFLKNNNKLVNKLKSKYAFNDNHIVPNLIYIYSEGSKNYFEWAINLYYSQYVNIRTLKSIFNWVSSYSQLTKNLTKGTVTAYTTKSSIEALLNELNLLRKTRRILETINSFNTVQKKILKNADLSEKDKLTLEKFSKLSEVKRINFIKKVSTIEDFNELMRQMRLVSSVHFDWNKESFNDYLENVEGLNYKKILENGQIVLLQVMDYESIKQLAKTTNWCISKNKSYWNTYVEQHSGGGGVCQYLVYDFSKREDDNLSIVGFTVKHNKGITNAHDFVNTSLMESTRNINSLNSYISNFLEKNNIYSILEKDGIDISMVSLYDNPQYKWNKQELLKYLYECVNKENVDILMEEESKMVISVKDENLRYFFGESYFDNISSDHWGKQHILFLDFSCSKFDSEKLQYGIINSTFEEDYCISMFNEHSLPRNVAFETKLIEYNLPYDIIRRNNDTFIQMRDAFTTFNTPMLKECLKQYANKRKAVLKIVDEIGHESFYELVMRSIKEFLSFDFIDILYENGLRLEDTIGKERLYRLLTSLCKSIYQFGRIVESNFSLPLENDITSFYAKKIGSKEYTLYIGNYILLEKLIIAETSKGGSYNRILQGVVEIISTQAMQGEIFDHILTLCGERMNLNESKIMRLYNKFLPLAGKELIDFAKEHGFSVKKSEYTSSDVFNILNELSETYYANTPF